MFHVEHKASMTSDHRLRSFVKAISWRLVGSFDTFLISWLLTGAPVVAGSIAGVEACTKLALFWAHERVWNRIGWGRRPE